MLSREDHYMIKQLSKQGLFVVDIAHRIGCSEKTVRRHLNYPMPPTGKHRQKREAKLDAFRRCSVTPCNGFFSEQKYSGIMLF